MSEREIPIREKDRILILAPHPDDETLGAGGLILRALASGAQVRVIFLTNGDNSPWVQRIVEHRWEIGPVDRARFGNRRCNEAIRALSVLGVPRENISFWSYLDQGMTDLLINNSRKIVDRLVSKLEEWVPTVLVTPSMLDLHPDHNATAVMVYFALNRLKGKQIPRHILSYIIHGRNRLNRIPEVVKICLNQEKKAKKLKALTCHESQMTTHKRKFLSLAKSDERFIIGMDYSKERMNSAPVTISARGKNTLWLKLERNSIFTFLRWSKLYTIGVKDSETVSASSIKLNKKRKATIKYLAPHRDKEPTSALWYRGNVSIQLPMLHLREANMLLVKLRQRMWFFDKWGWNLMEIPRYQPKTPKICAVIPCYNIASLCGEVVQETFKYSDFVIAIDDGSTDETGEVLKEIINKNKTKATLLSMNKNRGKGAALMSGFKYALDNVDFDVLVTLDGDKQHRPQDIPKLIEAYSEGAEFIIGERENINTMPLRSRIGNTLTRIFLRKVVSPSCPLDTQSGFRAFDRQFLQRIVEQVKGGRYETEIQILLLAIKENRKIATVPIPTIYLNGNRSSHFRPGLDSIRIFISILKSLLAPRYILGRYPPFLK